MSRSRFAVPLVVVVAVSAASLRVARSAEQRPMVPQPVPEFSKSEAEQRDRDIAFYTERASRDASSAGDRQMLAQLYLQRARERGSYEDYVRAERAARESLSLRRAHNSRAMQLLASSLLAQHEFGEALEVARALVRDEPDVETFRALLGECQLETGDYRGASDTFASLTKSANHLAVAPRLARWYEITGRTDDARRVLLGAQRDAERARLELPAEQLAWFRWRVGDFELRHGRIAEAESALRGALAAYPGDYRALATLARLEAARGAWRTAITLGEQAITISIDPATLGLLSDAYLAIGDSAKAGDYANAMEVSVLAQPGAFHRAWGLFLLDRGGRGNAERVYRDARTEIVTRRDVYGYDLLAWSLHALGRKREARAAARRALAQGTQDPQLLHHAGMIELAAGDTVAGRRLLEQALWINPTFHHTLASSARATLDSLTRVRAR
jgi:tetratricopeptide (TPR) repeat protein